MATIYIYINIYIFNIIYYLTLYILYINIIYYLTLYIYIYKYYMLFNIIYMGFSGGAVVKNLPAN